MLALPRALREARTVAHYAQVRRTESAEESVLLEEFFSTNYVI